MFLRSLTTLQGMVATAALLATVWLAGCGGLPRPRVTIDHSSPLALVKSEHMAVCALDFAAILNAHQPADRPLLREALETLHCYVQADRQTESAIRIAFGDEDADRWRAAGSGLRDNLTTAWSLPSDGLPDWGQVTFVDSPAMNHRQTLQVNYRAEPTGRLLVNIAGNWYEGMDDVARAIFDRPTSPEASEKWRRAISWAQSTGEKVRGGQFKDAQEMWGWIMEQKSDWRLVKSF